MPAGITAAAPPQGSLVLLRHGETEWSKSGQHTGHTDIPLTVRGEQVDPQIKELLKGRAFSLVLTSPLQRARRTAALVGLDDAQIDDNLREWDYGGYEGLTTTEVRARAGHPWTVFVDGVIPGAAPGSTPGESIEEVAARCRKVLDRVMPFLVTGDVALVGHGHSLRILAAVFLRQELRFGSQILLDAGSVSVLGWEREMPVIDSWNRTLP